MQWIKLYLGDKWPLLNCLGLAQFPYHVMNNYGTKKKSKWDCFGLGDNTFVCILWPKSFLQFFLKIRSNKYKVTWIRYSKHIPFVPCIRYKINLAQAFLIFTFQRPSFPNFKDKAIHTSKYETNSIMYR